MDNEVKPTWQLAWGLWWRGVLITLGIAVVLGAIMFGLHMAGVLHGMHGYCGWLPAGW